ncbi:MAG: hypothetical protein FWF09_02605, partial [Bacteroidales bacterium]|nr:hypothetical protein [Bacteroidales bacterium]
MDKKNLTDNRKGFSQRIKNICALRAFARFCAFCLLPSAFAPSCLRAFVPLETVRRVRPQDRKRL